MAAAVASWAAEVEREVAWKLFERYGRFRTFGAFVTFVGCSGMFRWFCCNFCCNVVIRSYLYLRSHFWSWAIHLHVQSTCYMYTTSYMASLHSHHLIKFVYVILMFILLRLTSKQKHSPRSVFPVEDGHHIKKIDVPKQICNSYPFIDPNKGAGTGDWLHCGGWSAFALQLPSWIGPNRTLMNSFWFWSIRRELLQSLLKVKMKDVKLLVGENCQKVLNNIEQIGNTQKEMKRIIAVLYT